MKVTLYYTPPHFQGGAARCPNGGNLTRWLVGFPKQKISTAAGDRNSRKRMQNATPCRRPVLLLPHSLHCSASTLCMRARSWSSCSIGLLRTRLVSWPADSNNILDPVRLALPRSPESGIAVSSCAKILSREKRKMWVPYKENVLSVVVSFRAHNPFLQRVWYANAKNFRERGIFTRCSCRVNWQRLLFLAHGMISSS